MAETSYDLGHKPTATASPAYMSESTKVYYPSLSLSSTEFPPVKAWTVGKTYQVTVSLKMIGMDLRGKTMRGEFDVVKACA